MHMKMGRKMSHENVTGYVAVIKIPVKLSIERYEVEDMKNLKETEKNFLTCAGLIAMVGIALIVLKQTTLGILSIIAAVVFVAAFFKMVVTRKKEGNGEAKKHENSK